MRDRNGLDVERAEREPRHLRNAPDGNPRGAGFGQAPRLQQVGGEGRHVDRAAEAGPEIRQPAEMILMGMRDDDAEEVLLLRLDESRIGIEQVDPRQVIAREGHAAIDHDPLPPFRRAEPVQRHVHADFAKPPQRYEDQFFRCHPRVLTAVCGSASASARKTSPTITASTALPVSSRR